MSPRSIVRRLHVDAIAATQRGALKTFVVQVPPSWRRKLIENGQAEFIPRYGDQFAVLEEQQALHVRNDLRRDEADSFGDFMI